MSEKALSSNEPTRDKILAAAHALFLERGYHGTSMRQIAQCAGVALGGIYNHFASKEEIFLSVLMDHHPIFDLLPAMLDAQGETVEGIVRDAAHRMVLRFDQRLDFLNLLFIELVEFKGQHLGEIFQAVFSNVMGFAERLLSDQSSLKPIPLPILLRAFIGLFFSYLMTEILIGRQLPPEMSENALDYFVDIYLYGIMDESR